MLIRKLLTPAFLFFLVFFTYLHNLSHSVYGGDVGDLVTAAFVGGVPHPPGYPLFTLLGFILTRIHFFYSPAYAVGLISVISGTLGIIFFYQTVKILTKNDFISFISSSILAFSYFYWFYSEIAEVFALNSLLLILLIFLAVKINIQNKVKLLPFLFFAAGLSLTNHQTIFLTFPSLIILLLPAILKMKKKKQIIIKFILINLFLFILGFSIYLYVPVASFGNPVLNWDKVKDVQSFLHLFLRKDYGTFSAGLFATPSLLQRILTVRVYLVQIFLQFTIPVITLCFVGVIYLFKKNRILLLSLILGFVITGPLFIGYAGFPLTGNFYFGVNERFFLLSSIFLFFFFPFGLLFLSDLFKKTLHTNPVLLQTVFLIIPLMLYFYNFPKTNLSNVYVGDNYGYDILTTLPPKSLIFLAGDTIIFNAWYTHYVLGIRPDVNILNISGDIASPYYSVLKEKYKSDHPNASESETREGIIKVLPKEGTVFSVQELEPSDEHYTWIPYGLLLQLVTKETVPSEEKFTKTTDAVWSKMHIPNASEKSLAASNPTISDIPNSYANAMLITGNFYLSEYHNPDKAKEWYDKAIKVSPEYEKIYSSLGVWYLADKKCTLAEKNFKKAIEINAVGELNYFLLYTSYEACSHDKNKAHNLTKDFEKQFQIPFKKAYDSFIKK